MLESLTAIRRAGADLILTYYAGRGGRASGCDVRPQTSAVSERLAAEARRG